jgi:hypothetical protein
MASGKKNAAPAAKTNWAKILGSVGTIGAVIAVPFFAAHQAIDNALVYTFGEGNLYDVRAPRPTFSGFIADDVKLTFEDGSLMIKQIEVDIGFWGMLKNAYAFRMDKPVDQVKMIYRDIKNPESYIFFDPMGIVGTESASIFEAQGCGEHEYWTDEELSSAMNLSTSPGTMTVEFSTEGDSVVRTTSFLTPGAGSATFVTKAEAIQTNRTMFSIPYSGKTRAVGMTVSDAGFIKARNSFCAQFTGVSEAQFIDNHVASIERSMLAGGAKPSPQMMSVYKAFASNGGDLELDVARREFQSTSGETLGQVLSSIKGEIRLGEMREAFSVETTPPVSFPSNAADLTAYQVLVQENALPVNGVSALDNTANADGSAGSTVVVQGKVERLLAPEIIAINRIDPEYLTSFSAVLAHKGRRMRFERNSKPPLDAYLLGQSKNGLWLRVRQPGGYAEIEMPRADFKRALLYPNNG